MTTLWPYRTVKNKHYFRSGKKRMVVEKTKPQYYVASGDIIFNRPISLVSDETISYANVEIKVR